MALKGDLASVDLAQVFQMLALNQKVGMLCISSPRGWRALYFEPRGVCLYFDEHVLLDKVVLQASRSGHLTQDAAQEARRHSATHHVGLADALLAGGYLNEAELSSMLRSEMEEEMFDLFFWTEAHFEFYEGASAIEGRDGQIDARFCFSIDTVIMEAARRIDEWSFIQERVSGPLEIFRPRGMPTNILDLEDSALALYDLVDGKRNVARLIEVTGLPAFLVYKGLAVLLDEGLVEDLPVEDVVATAHECAAEGRQQDAINLYERSIAQGVGIPEAHQHAARVYEAIGEYELAAYHHKCDAEFSAGSEDVRRAVETLLNVVAMLPTDLAARERLVELTVGCADLGVKDFDATRTGKELVDLYLEIGEVERVRAILERLLRDNPFDVELKKSLVNVHTKAGDTKRVIELYESIAEDLVQARKPLEAIKFLQKILMLDRSRKDVSERIRSLYVLDERRRSRRRSIVAMCVLGVVAAALGGAWWFYEQHARTELVAVEARVEKLLELKDYDHAGEQYRNFVKEYPFTLVGREVDVEVAHIESLQAKHRERLEAERRSRQVDNERTRQQYRTAWEVFQSLVRSNELDKALRQVESIRDMVEQIGEPADRKWAQDVGLDRNLRRLKDYLGKAFELDRRAWEELRGGDWAAARALWVELVQQYEMSDAARAARLPVHIISHPEGALVMRGGRPVFQRETGSGEPLRTPCVVLCEHGEPEALELQFDGFEDAKLRVDAQAQETIDTVLVAKPAAVLRFDEPARGPIAVSGGLLAVGLRNGRIAFVSSADGAARFVRQLPGLDELEGSVTLSSTLGIYLTREGSLVAQSLTTGRVVWSERPGARPVFSPLIVGNRVLYVDDRNRLVAMDANAGGEPIWSLQLAATPAAEPTVDGRILRLATSNGDVLGIDVTDGSTTDRFRLDGRVVTPPVTANGALIFGTDTGRVLAVEPGTHRTLWEYQAPSDVAIERIAAMTERLLVLDSDNRLAVLGLRDGVPQASIIVDGQVASGPVIGGDRAFVTMRQKVGRGVTLEVLIALDAQSLRMLWEFRDGGAFSTPVAVVGNEALVGNSKGEVLRFR